MPGLAGKTGGLPGRRRAFGAGPRQEADAGMSEVRGFGFNPGALRMLAYVPVDLPQGAPLVVVLHGCTQRAGAFARGAGWLTLADRLGFALLAPEQERTNNPNGCFNWFEPADTQRGMGEAASIHAMVQHIVEAHGLDAGRLFITGLSAGGAMAAVMLATYPETFAAGAVVAGLPFGVANNVQEALGAMGRGATLGGRELGELVAAAAPPSGRPPRLAVWHGLNDRTVGSRNADALARQWAAVHRLSDEPDEVVSRGIWTRAIWRDAGGSVAVERNLLAGLGHGTPLAAAGDDPIGQVAPFLLEAGVSSSLEIARFWGLAPDATAKYGSTAGSSAPESHPTRVSLGESVMRAVSPHVSADVEAVIAAALGRAGLID